MQHVKEYVRTIIDGYSSEKFRGFISHLREREDRELLAEELREAVSAVPEENLFFRNVLLNELETLEGNIVLKSRIRSFMVTLTNRCNLSCRMCEARRYPWDMPEEIVKEIREGFPYLEYIMWQGGEVFMKEYFGEMLDEAGRHPHMKQLIVTNGLMLDEKLIDKLTLQPDLVLAISMDGEDEKLYEGMRTGADFHKLRHNLAMLNRKRAEKRSKLALNLNVVVMKANYRHLPGLLELAREEHFSSVLFRPIQGNRDDEQNIFVNRDEEALKEIGRIWSAAPGNTGSISTTGCLRAVRRNPKFCPLLRIRESVFSAPRPGRDST